jgi:hypothetical protein
MHAYYHEHQCVPHICTAPARILVHYHLAKGDSKWEGANGVVFTTVKASIAH